MARAAIRYAKAVLSLAQEQNAADVVNNDMKLIANTIANNQELSAMLKNPIISATIKKATLLEVFKDTNALTGNLINTLITNNRIDAINTVALKYTSLFEASKGIQLATVTTATPLTEVLKDKVLAKAKELAGQNVQLESHVDETLLGGFVLRIGDLQYDASVANQLNKLKREFTIN